MRAPVVRVAPFWRRVLADLLDLSLLGLCAWALWVGGVIAPTDLPPQRFDWIDYAADLLANHRQLFWRPLIAVPTVGLMYAISTRALLGGRTLGELALNLRLIKRDGSAPGPFRVLAHGVGTLMGLALLGLGYAWAAVDVQRQGLAELFSGSLLIVGRPESPRD